MGKGRTKLHWFCKFLLTIDRKLLKSLEAITDAWKTKVGKHSWFWGEEQNNAFEELKRGFTSALIVAYFYPDQKTVIETDASDIALGYILCQYLGKRLQ